MYYVCFMQRIFRFTRIFFPLFFIFSCIYMLLYGILFLILEEEPFFLVGLLVIISLLFISLKRFLLCFLFQSAFTGYRILNQQDTPPPTPRMLKLSVIVFWLPLFLNDILISLKVIYIFSYILPAFKIFGGLIFNSFTMMCLGMGVLYLSHLRFEANLLAWSLVNFRKILAITLQILLLTHSLYPNFLDSNDINIFGFLPPSIYLLCSFLDNFSSHGLV